jgi:hypothetical protein
MSDDFQGRGGSPWGTPPGGGNGSGKDLHHQILMQLLEIFKIR